jgi:hypothetical protein
LNFKMRHYRKSARLETQARDGVYCAGHKSTARREGGYRGGGEGEVSDPDHCVFCGAGPGQMSGTWGTKEVTICHDCIEEWLGGMCHHYPERFEAIIARARNYKPDSN